MDIKVTVQGTEKLVSQIGAIATNAQERHALSFTHAIHSPSFGAAQGRNGNG